MSPRWRFTGLQFEIIANLFVVVVSGLAVVAVVMGTLATRSVEYSTLQELRVGARHLERVLALGSPRLEDLAAFVRSVNARTLGGSWTVLDERGRELGRAPNLPPSGEDVQELARAAETSGEVTQGGGIPPRDLLLAVSIVTARGERGTLVGRVSQLELRRRLIPTLYSGAWALAIAAGLFVLFGSYLLRRRIVRPLQALSLATRQIATGDLDVDIPVSGSDELANLARSFNDMAESLAREKEALVRAHRSLRQSERLAAVGQLAAGVAHEVGNPVAAILGYAEVMLRERDVSSRTRDATERIRDEALRIRAIVREFLDLSRPAAPEPAALDPVALLEGVASRMRSQELLRGIELLLVSETNLPPVLSAMGRVEQILVNLIENAAHAVRGGDEPRIELQAHRTRGATRPSRRREDDPEQSFLEARVPDAVALCVVDNGPGVAPEDQPNLFDPFFTTKEPGEGTGLGLWNCHRLAEIIGGYLEMESEPGRTCFSLVLPATDMEAGHVQSPRSDSR
jgi:signal transduction histidine kinase